MSEKIKTGLSLFSFGFPDGDEAGRQSRKNQEEIKERDGVSLFQDAVDNLNKRALEIQETAEKDIQDVIRTGKTKLHYELLGFNPAWFEYESRIFPSLSSRGDGRPAGYKTILPWRDVFSSASELQALLQEFKKKNYLVLVFGASWDFRNKQKLPASLDIIL